jgi:predicted glutamine amidotransferase
MCRFLMMRSEAPLRPMGLLDKFAAMASRSRSPDGDRQADGWGVAWLDEQGGWNIRKSANPIWTETHDFADIPRCQVLAVHVRSSSFPEHKGIVEFNQPFLVDSYAFVFNGLLQGVSFPFPVEGRIGSQKIWSLLQRSINGDGPAAGIAALVRQLESRAREIQAFNLGLFQGRRLFVYCRQTEAGSYYRLQAHQTPSLTLICSEILTGLPWRSIPLNVVLEL